MKIKIHDSTYIFMLLAFLAGYFEYIYLLLIIILFHEIGHCIFGRIVGIKVSRIDIYPFGGYVVFDSKLNIKIIYEFICLIGGVFFQIGFYIIIYFIYKNGNVSDNTFVIFHNINILLLFFNFFPVNMLDGGRLIKLFFDCIFPYKVSSIVCVIVSTLCVFLFVFFKRTIFSFFIMLIFLKNIIYEYQNIDILYNRFLLERYLYDFKFKRVKIIKNINYLYRDCTHIINNCFESKILKRMFDRMN